MHRKLISMMAVVLVICLAAGCAPAANTANNPAPTDAQSTEVSAAPEPTGVTIENYAGQIVIGTHEVGTGGYQNVALMIEGMATKFPTLQIRSLPSGTESTRAYYARLGDAQAFTTGGATPLYLQEGINGFDTAEWGPQEIGSIFYAPHNGYALGVTAKSDIQQVSDLKGKTVAITPASPSTVTSTAAMLAFGGLTWDDVVPYEVASSALGYEALANGKVDACFYNITASKAYEQLGLPDGLRFLQFPASDTEGWARVHATSPIEIPKLAYKGAGVDAASPIEVMSSAYPVLVAWLNVDADTIYVLTKAIWESRDEWAAKDETMAQSFTMDMQWELWKGDTVPMHAGAVRYYKEIGVWTDEFEQINNERLAHQADLKALWDTTLEESIANQTKSTDFPALWAAARTTAGY
jgi:TRAP transporter TAXI family solute receptor